jgi:hypothetical protein
VSGTIRYTESLSGCSEFDVDICCREGVTPDSCDVFTTDNCDVGYEPSKLYDSAPKFICGWADSPGRFGLVAPDPLPFGSRRSLSEGTRSLAQADCDDTLSIDDIVVAGPEAVVDRSVRDYLFTGFGPGECCQVAVRTVHDECESYDVAECCTDIEYTDSPTLSPTCEIPDSPEIACLYSTTDEITVEVLCPEGFTCSVALIE